MDFWRTVVVHATFWFDLDLCMISLEGRENFLGKICGMDRTFQALLLRNYQELKYNNGINGQVKKCRCACFHLF